MTPGFRNKRPLPPDIRFVEAELREERVAAHPEGKFRPSSVFSSQRVRVSTGVGKAGSIAAAKVSGFGRLPSRRGEISAVDVLASYSRSFSSRQPRRSWRKF